MVTVSEAAKKCMGYIFTVTEGATATGAETTGAVVTEAAATGEAATGIRHGCSSNHRSKGNSRQKRSSHGSGSHVSIRRSVAAATEEAVT
jgi:hypothetical protein